MWIKAFVRYVCGELGSVIIIDKVVKKHQLVLKVMISLGDSLYTTTTFTDKLKKFSDPGPWDENKVN